MDAIFDIAGLKGSHLNADRVLVMSDNPAINPLVFDVMIWVSNYDSASIIAVTLRQSSLP